MSLEGGAAILAFVLAGVSVGMWAGITTFQIRALKRSMCAVHTRLDAIVEALGLTPHLELQDTHGRHRDPGRVLDDAAAGLRRAGGAV